MYLAQRPLLRPALILLIFAALFLTACGSQGTNTNWPGLSTNGEKLYLANGPQVVAYDAATRAVDWVFPEQSRGTLQFYAAPSVQESQVVFGDYGAPGGFFSPKVTVSVYAVEDTTSGGTPATTWSNSADAQDKIVAPPLQVGDRVFIGTADNWVLALNNSSGEVLWRYETGHSIWGQPAYVDGKLLVASMDRSLYAFDADDGTILWRVELTGALPSSPVLNDTLVYIGSFDSQVHALDVDTGEEVWAAPAANWVWGAPAYADGAVYFADLDGNVYAVDAATGAPLWQKQTLGAVQTSPLVVGDMLYVASEGQAGDQPAGALTAFSTADGSEQWQKLTPAPLFTAPVAVEDLVVVALQSEEASLIAFNQATGEQTWSVAPYAPSE